MILVVTSLLVAMMVLVAGVVGFAPSAYHILESDYMRRTTEEATLCGFQYGQLYNRAKLLQPGGRSQDFIVNDTYYDQATSAHHDVNITVNVDTLANLQVEVSYTKAIQPP